LITNSGGPPSGNFDQFSLDDWEAAYHLLLASTVALIKGFLPQMKAQKWGRIVAITSQAVKQPVDGLILSNSVRAAVSGLIKSLSNELGAYHITVNNLMPGSTETGRLQNLLKVNPSFKDSIKNIPLGRFGQPHEFAAAVAFFVSERASYITGTSLAVDGGSIKNIL
jgi:3-oxoacyl-[acyl-carrier protein] reductase